jgi:hypothetical protein
MLLSGTEMLVEFGGEFMSGTKAEKRPVVEMMPTASGVCDDKVYV